MIYVLTISKYDKRTKTGLRLFQTYDFDAKDDAQMKRTIQSFRDIYPPVQFTMEFAPKYKTVKNLMTGKDVVIEADTPHCCDPSAETYWSM